MSNIEVIIGLLLVSWPYRMFAANLAALRLYSPLSLYLEFCFARWRTRGVPDTN
jgi:hypothetical protein